MTVEELIRSLRIEIAPPGHHHTHHGWLQIDCPFCSKGWHKFRLGIHLTRNYGNCWVCGPKRLVDVLTEAAGLPIGRAVGAVKSLKTGFRGDDLVPRGKMSPPPLGELQRAHKRYLTNRGFDPEKITQLWGIKGIGINGGKYKWRLWIPVTLRGEIVSWTARSLDPEANLRYFSARPDQESVDHKKLLYGEDLVRNGSVVVCEGPVDAWAVGPGAVALFGLNYTKAQVRRIAAYPRRALMADAEPKATQVMEALADDLSVFPGETYIIRLETGKDAATASRREIRQIRRKCLDGIF